jgi:hypothetical protein
MSYQLGDSFGVSGECQYPDSYTDQCLDSLIPTSIQQSAECQIVHPWSGQCLDDVYDPAALPQIPDQQQPQLPIPTTATCKVIEPYTGKCLDEYMQQVPGTQTPQPDLSPGGVGCEWGTPCADCNMEGTTAPFCVPAGQIPGQPGSCPGDLIGTPPYCYPPPDPVEPMEPFPTPGVPYEPQAPAPAKTTACPPGKIGSQPNCYSTVGVAVAGAAGLGILGYVIYKLSQKPSR